MDETNRGAMVAARVAPEEREAIRRVAAGNDRTPSREIRRAIRFYLENLQAADEHFRAKLAGGS